jgi:hypothetical protein
MYSPTLLSKNHYVSSVQPAPKHDDLRQSLLELWNNPKHKPDVDITDHETLTVTLRIRLELMLHTKSRR